MSCVTKNSKEFKDAVRRLDVHPDNLEVVLHKFLNTEGREDVFPTDAEIMGELRAKPFEATDAEVKYYLGAEHQGQKKFGNLADATHQLEAFKMLYSGTPTMYRDSMGNYIVEAGIPMLKGIPINMGIPFTMDNTTIDQVLQTLDSNNAHHNTLRALIDALGKENIHISMGIIKKKDTTMKNMKGEWGDPIAVHGVNGIKFDPFTYRKYLDSTFKPEDTAGRESDFRRVLLHELTHQLSSKVLESDEANLNPEELKFKREIERLYKIAKESTNYEFYGLENIEEFVSEAFSNNSFRRYLRSIKDNGNRTLLSKFIDAIGKLLSKFGLKVPIKHSVLSSVVAATTEFRDFHKAEREKQQAEIKLRDGVIEQEFMEAPLDDLFSPSNEGFYSLKNKFDRDADGYREGQYSFESRRYYNKDGTYMVFNIPTYRVSLDEAITKGYEMLEKLGFDTEDFDLKGPVKESRDGGQYLNVKVRPLVERQIIRAKRKKLALEEKETRDAYENYKLSQLTDRERILNSFNQSERDFIDRIEQTDPELAKQVLDGMITIEEADELIRDGELNYSMSKSVQWDRTAPNSYEVSTQGDSRFSALKAKFKSGTIIDGVDVGGMTIENVYQSVIKKSSKGKAPSRNSKLFVYTTPKLKGKMSFAFGNQRANGVTATTTLEAIKRGERTATTRYTSDGNIDYWKQAKVGDVIEFSDQNGEKVLVRVTKELHQLPTSTTAEEWSAKEGWDTSRFEQRVKPQIDKGEAYQMEFEYIDQSKEAMEDFSYREGYLPLWQEWARQNPELMQELREKSAGKVLTDKFANTRVSQARALAEILNSDSTTTPTDEISIDSLISKLDPSDKLGNIVLSRAKDLGIKVKRVHIESDRIESGISGQFKADESTIYIDPDNMQENTLVHEAIHSITSYYFNAKRESLPKEIQIALQEIEYCHELLKQDFIEEHFYENGKLKEGINLEKAFSFWIDNDSYGLTSPEEMIAEIGKPTFLNRIRKYDAKHKGDKSIFTKLVNAIVKLFSNSKEYSSVEKTIKDAMMTLFNTPNKELFSKHSNEIRTIKENYKTLRSVDKNVITIFPAPKVAEMIESSIGDEMREYTITLDPYTIGGMFSPEGARNFLTKPAPNTIIKVQVGKAKGLLVLTKPAEVISKEEGAKITVVPLDANYLKTHKLEVKVDNNVAHLVNFTLEYDISETSGIPITESTDFKLQRFSAEFEGASNNLVGIVPEPLLSKVGDYIMSGGEIGLSEADAQQFLNYAETAYAEQETTNQEQQPIKKENQSYMERAITITQQIDNLNNSTALSATEVRHIAEQAVYWISDHITEIQETPGLAEKIYGEQFKDKDFASMSRADVVRTIDPDAIIAMCREKFSPENTDYEDLDTIDKAKIITDNWKAIMMLASDVFLSVEDFSIVSSKDGTTSEVNTDYLADADNFDYSNMEADVLENEGDLQEHWQVETKTLDVLATMSQMVKKALIKCYLLDKDGNNITSEFGINERVNVREATNSILRWTQGALNLEQLIIKLQEKADSNPWVRQIIDRLSDKSGKEADFQSQFFVTFCKHFQSYSVVIEENGKYKSIQVNENPALSEAMTQVTTQYKIGEHPLFTTEGINKGAFKELKSAFEELSKYNHQGYDLTNIETRDEAARTLGYISNLLGYYVTPEMVADNLNKDTFKRMFSALRYITNSLERNLDNNTYEPFKFGSKDGINGNTREFLKPITDHLEDIAVSAFYDSGKMYQSYITPSYTTKLFQKFGQTGQAFDDFIMSEYGNMPWFHTGTNIERGWRNSWLKSLATDSKAREIFKHKVQLNFNKHNYMKNMSDMEYTLSILTEYFSESASEKQTRVPAWFRVPMLSNKPSSEFIRFYSERGANYRESLTNGFKMIFDQELSRIQTVEMRNLSKGDPRFIKNFDTNGKKFMFLDFMNEYLTGSKKSSELGKLIREKLDGKKIDEARLNELVKNAIMETMNARADAVVASWEAQGIFKGAEKITNIGTTEEEIRENLKNFVWNDTFADMNIMQLTITDIAFYKDAEDLQKRLAQIHAPGVRGNVRATDYEGRPVTDGNFRTIKFTDFDTFISNIIDNVSVVFDRKIASAPESEKAALRALKDSLVGKDGAFRQINVADAQGYSSPTSYRKKAFIFGKWSRKAEEVYKKLKEGTYTYSDLQVAFQPLKPLVYSQIIKDTGVDGAPLDKLKVPVQYKNSEYLLIMADALLQGEDTGKPNLLRAIFEVMEESHFDKDGNYKTDGIDTAQFESTVKSGLMGRINLNDLVNDPNGESIAKARMEAAIYEATAKEVKETNPENGVEETKTIYERTGAYNNSAVDVVPFEDYCLQQEVPEHFKEHEQAHGSQLRYILVSELENFNYLGEPVTYNLEGKQVTAQEFKAEYENTIAENIQESIDELAEELSLNDLGSIKDRNIALSKILQREILSSPRYGVDLLQACSVDENGRFRIPLGDPIQSKRVEQLINSIIKNRINKQKIAGGPVVQVTNFGTSKELNIRFKDKSGNLLMTRAEYEKNPIKKEMSQTDKFNARYKKGGAQSSTNNTMSYEDYIKENQAGIAYFEVFAPIYSNQLFNQFADKNGVISIQALEMLDPDLLKMIGYRIPTEDKYSMAPLKIVGFLPREAGDGIMLPNDITLLTGSDFDVDKEYLMRKEYNIIRSKTTRSEIHRILYDGLVNSQKGKLTYELKSQLRDLVDQFLDDPFNSSSLTNQKTAKGYISMPKGAYNKMLRTYMQNMYTVNKPTEGRTYRNNKIVDMTYEVLTHETSAYKMLNPGGFDPQKRMGYLVSAYKQHSDKYTWEQLQGMTISQLKDLNNSNKNLSYIDTHIQFYKQNSAAGALIGIFAVNRIAHAVLESGSIDGSSTYKMNVDNVCKITRNFTVAGMEFGGLMPFDMRYDRNGQLIGKVMGSLVASAADAVKDPVLNLMNINSNTANILNTLIRFGMPFDNAALFLSQSVISDVLADFSRENITGYKSLSKVIQDRLNQIKDETNIDESSEINKEELTLEELVEGLKPNVKPEIAYKTLVAFSNFQKMAEAMRMPTFATRFNSMSSAVGPLIIDNLITEYKMQKLSLESNIVDAEDNPVDMSNIFLGHPILNQFQKTVGIAKQLFGNMPANSTGFRNILDLVNESPLSNVILGDRKLLSSLSDFYQSYLVMKNGVVNPNELGYFITEFPKEFMEKEYKKKYADNALIQAIKYGTDKSGRATLQVDITGLDTQQKEKYSSAWIDLHKVDPDLSIKLFNYNFFRGGIGFSPKTFMSLVPVYVKERIPGYVDTFRVLPSIVPETVLDQFIRNNWDNNRLVPRKKVTLKHLPNGHVEVFKPSEIKELTGVQYFKTKVNNEDKLFMQILEMDGAIEYKEITPLGSNKEYLEMSESTIDSPLNIPTEAKVETTAAETGKQSELAETEVSAEAEETETATTDEARLNDLLHQILVIEGVRNEEQAGEYIRNYQAKSEAEKAKMEKQTKKFFETRFKKLNIEFNSKLIDDIYKLIC